jgi:Tol biopolymer transport system component
MEWVVEQWRARGRVLAGAVVASAAIAASGAVVTTADAARLDNEVVSVTDAGVPSDGLSLLPDMSPDGRYVAFISNASNLPGANGRSQVYLRDMATKTTRLVTGTSGTGFAADTMWGPQVSADGRFVAFTSDAREVPGLPNASGTSRVYVRDMKNGTFTLVSAENESSLPLSGTGHDLSMSDDGRRIAFSMMDANWNEHVYVRDLNNGTTVLASAVDGSDTPADETAGSPAISGDGSTVAFDSSAGNLTPSSEAGETQVYVRKLATKRTVMASVNTDGRRPDSSSWAPELSYDGNEVAFSSAARDLVSGVEFTASVSIFKRTLSTGQTELVSAATATEAADKESDVASISRDGRWVTFTSLASNLPGADDEARLQVYIRDTATGSTQLVSAVHGGTEPGNADSTTSSVSADGRYVAFDTAATNLTDATENTWQIVRRDLRGAAAPVNEARPAITGQALTGHVLQCQTGTWSPVDKPTEPLVIEWLRDGAVIATGSSYEVTPADVGRQLRCRVTATNEVGSTVAVSDVVIPSQPGAPGDPHTPGNPADTPRPGTSQEPPASQGPIGPANAPGGSGQPGSPNPQGGNGGNVAVIPRNRLTISLRRVAKRIVAGRRVRVTYVASGPATVRLEVRRGRRVVARVTGKARTGKNTIAWNGRHGKRSAKPGRYTLTLRATGRGTQTAAVRTFTVTVVKPKRR